ncbi:D-alanyl-D-alanine carboxypeptidase [Candidatus Uhrbacteria bacterium]|nr:D-alanyl-D-alanine carboxypeptidase [Candidatus Uhrbacteria bacterium]
MVEATQKFFFFFVSTYALLSVAFFAHAQELHIDAATLEKGYSAKSTDGLFGVSVFPKTFTAPVQLSIEKKYSSTDAPFFVPPPITHVFASDVYAYDLKRVKPQQPLILSLQAKSSIVDDPSIAYYDRNKKAWFFLRSNLNEKGSVTSAFSLPFSYVALLSPRREVAEVNDMMKGMHAGYVLDDKLAVLYAKNEHTLLPIASLTKLMTALVFLDHNPGWFSKVTIRPSDDAAPAKVAFRKNEVAVVKDLFYATLVGSANNTAKALARSTGLSEKAFVSRMNEKARFLGMTHTTFADCTGLDPQNQSTAKDVALLAKTAFGHPDIMRATATATYVMNVVNTKRKVTIQNTNKLITEPYVSYAKTGFTDEAGYNFAVRVLHDNREVTAVLLGGRLSKTRFDIAKNIISKQLLSHNQNITASTQ